MSSCNRIPWSSVSFSETVYLFEVPEITNKDTEEHIQIEEEIETEEERSLREREEKVIIRERELQIMENDNLQLKKNLEEKMRVNELEQEEFFKKLKDEREEFEQEKRRDYYDMRLFMWNKSIELAESLVFQKIEANDLSHTKTLEGMISKLPIAFDELSISVNPDTIKLMDEETIKESWVLKNVKWKYDYSLSVGEFVVEEENEFYEYKYASMFQEIKKRIQNKLEMEKSYD